MSLTLAVGGGSAEDGKEILDSSNNEMEEVEPLEDRRKKKAKRAPAPILALLVYPGAPMHLAGASMPHSYNPQPTPPLGPGWSWVPMGWQQNPPPAAWLARAGDVIFHPPSESTVHRKKRATYESGSRNRATYTTKPSFVHVQEGGFINASSEGKNAWDTALRDFVPKIVDVSAVEWSQHKPQTLQRLRDALDKEFEYVGNPLSLAGFHSVVTKFLKSEHYQLKARYLSGNVEAPVHVKDDQWK